MRNEETMCEGLLSVVIPVYNIRDYVERCVRSGAGAAGCAAGSAHRG